MKSRTLKFCLVLAIWVLAAGLPAALPSTVPTSTPRIDYSSMACFDLANTLEPDRTWIPVGCEALLCCPGCPDVGIDWRIRVSGEPVESVLLQFENLPPSAVRELRINGKARWEGAALRVWPGETVVSGFKNDPRATPAVAKPRLFANRESLRRLREAADREEAVAGSQVTRPGGRSALPRMEVSVEQLMGKYPVSEARVAYSLRACGQPTSGDHILLNNNQLNDNVIAMMDARPLTGDCLRDEFFRGVVQINVGDLQRFDSCFSETSIFSTDNGMYYIKPDIWTDSPNDEHVVTLPKMFVAPVAVWIARTGTPEQLTTTRERAERDMAKANYLYNTNKTGIAFEPTYADAVDLAAIANGTCSNVSRVKASEFYRPGQLNIYYIDSPIPPGASIWRGVNCDEDANIIFINFSAYPETLAHEFGHAFSLCHPNKCGPNEERIPDIGGNNLMMDDGLEGSRYEITIGQAFRMNLNSNSMMNVNGLRAGWSVRDPPCFDTMVTELCPKLSADIKPK